MSPDQDLPEGEPDEVTVSDDPVATLRTLVLTFEAQRQQLEGLVLWPLDTRYGEFRSGVPDGTNPDESKKRPIKPTRAVKGMPPIIVQVIKRAEQWRESRLEAERLQGEIDDFNDLLRKGEINEKMTQNVIASLIRAKTAAMEMSDRHQMQAERLLLEALRVDTLRMREIQKALERATDREERMKMHRDRRRDRMGSLDKLPTHKLLEAAQRSEP